MKNVLVKEKSIIYARFPPDGVGVGLRSRVGMQVSGKDLIFRREGGMVVGEILYCSQKILGSHLLTPIEMNITFVWF